MRLEELGHIRTPMTSLEIEPVTFLLVAECLNKLLYGVLHTKYLQLIYIGAGKNGHL
jgi:hypothetical protein